MFGDCSDDCVYDLAMGSFSGPDVDVRLGIGRSFLAGEPLEGSLGVAVSKQGTRVAPGGSAAEHLHRRIEPDGDRPLLEQFTGLGVDEHAAASGDDAHLPVDQPGDQAPLALPIFVFPESLEDLGGRISGRILDLGIAVDKGQAEPLGQAPADRGFARAHEADKDERAVETFGEFVHGRGYTAAPKLGQKPLTSKSKRNIMRPLPFLIIVVLLVAGLLYFLSTRPQEVPTRTIEAEVSQNGDAR